MSSLVLGTGIGVAPAVLKFENVLKGTSLEKELTIQNPGKSEITCSIEVEGEIVDWITIESDKVDIAGSGSINIKVMIRPPANIENGIYSGKFHVRAIADSNIEGSGVGLLPGVDSVIVVSITDKEITTGEVSKILTKDEEKGDPVKFIIGFSNEGNVDASPNVNIIIRKGDTDIVDSIDKTLKSVKPGKEIEYEVEWDTDDKETGVYYRAQVGIYLNGEYVEEKEVGFRILESTKEDSDVESKGKETSINLLPLILFIIAIGVLILIAYYIFRIIRKL